MTAADFERHFKSLGLDRLSADVSCDATFTPDPSDTIASRPREEGPDAQADGTLPQLVFAAPEAAREGQEDQADLVAVKVLGEGGMGRVLLARQHSLGREVAVKVLKANSLHAQAAQALIEEARTTGSLEHPGWCRSTRWFATRTGCRRW